MLFYSISHNRILADSYEYDVNADDDKRGLLWVRHDLPSAHFQVSRSFAKISISKKTETSYVKLLEKAMAEGGKLRST